MKFAIWEPDKGQWLGFEVCIEHGVLQVRIQGPQVPGHRPRDIKGKHKVNVNGNLPMSLKYLWSFGISKDRPPNSEERVRKKIESNWAMLTSASCSYFFSCTATSWAGWVGAHLALRPRFVVLSWYPWLIYVYYSYEYSVCIIVYIHIYIQYIFIWFIILWLYILEAGGGWRKLAG